MLRAATGLTAAAAIAFTAVRARTLAPTGGVAATAVGAISVAAGWSWGALLIAFFVSSTALSHIGRAAKERRTAGTIEKSGPRDAAQVLANGGMFAAAAGLYLAFDGDVWLVLGAGALAAATADTWATEVGALWFSLPRSVTTWREVPVGTSGAVSPAGCLASVAGAAFVAVLVRALAWPESAAVGALAGGIGGAAIDSLAGALWQSRRRCTACDAATERRVHTCGASTRHAGGVRWLNNDGVNVLSTATGAVVALLAWL